MEAIIKSTGRKIHGRLAEILVKKGSATPFENTEADLKPAPVKKALVVKKPVKKAKK